MFELIIYSYKKSHNELANLRAEMNSDPFLLLRLVMLNEGTFFLTDSPLVISFCKRNVSKQRERFL